MFVYKLQFIYLFFFLQPIKVLSHSGGGALDSNGGSHLIPGHLQLVFSRWVNKSVSFSLSGACFMLLLSLHSIHSMKKVMFHQSLEKKEFVREMSIPVCDIINTLFDFMDLEVHDRLSPESALQGTPL